MLTMTTEQMNQANDANLNKKLKYVRDLMQGSPD